MCQAVVSSPFPPRKKLPGEKGSAIDFRTCQTGLQEQKKTMKEVTIDKIQYKMDVSHNHKNDYYPQGK